MASNLFSRFTGSNNASASIYDTIREHDEDSGGSDVEERAGLVAEGQLADQGYLDLDSPDPNLTPPQVPSRHLDASTLDANRGQASRKDKSRIQHRPRWSQGTHKLLDVEEADDEVPASLLIDHNAGGREHGSISLPPPPSQTSSDGIAQRRDGSRRQSPGHPLRSQTRRPSGLGDQQHPRTDAVPAALWGNLASADPKEKAMFRWVNVTNLDNFLLEVYTYYVYHGFWSILLMRLLNLVTVAFVVGFSIFLTQCINYRDIRGSTKMSEILVPQCGRNMGFLPNALLWLTTFIWIWKSALYVIDIPRLNHMHDFYHHLLNIPEQEIQSISWQEVVSRLMALRDSNPTITSTSKKPGGYIRSQDKQRMDAHDIANRLMRRQNYMIAMINKDILDLTLPIPFLRNRKLFTRTLEWNIDMCIMDFVFNRKGQVRTLFLKDTHRKDLSEALRKRFILAGVASLLFAPFLAIFFILKHFFENFNEYQKNPAQIGSREYSRFAQWKFREFNELYHLFQRRINMSYPFATRYINQFPKDKTIQAAQFVSLVSGAVVSVLGLATIFDQENFLNFEVTPGRTTIFYLGIFGSIWALARGLLPDDNMVYDTSLAIQEVIQFTHYEPQHWAGRLHTIEVKQEFSQLYQMKLVIFIEEVLSMIFTPFVLWFSLPKCSDRIIDFFREFTVHVDGLGYVCSFAEFNFMKQPHRAAVDQAVTQTAGTGISTGAANISNNTNTNPRDEYFASKDNKLENSYWGFMNDYARNPKTDIRFPYNPSRRRFIMPPPVPGLPSPLFPSADPGQAFGGGMGIHAARHGSTGTGVLGSPYRDASGTPGFGAQPHAHGHLPSQPLGSPLQSMLLDPHHQPSASGLVSSPQTLRPRGGGGGGVHGLFGRTRPDIPDELAEEDDFPPGRPQSSRLQPQPRPPPRSDGLAGAAGRADRLSDRTTQMHEGELGSWKYEDNSSSGEASEDEDSNAKAITALGALGPLGLIRQFQKAQTQDGGRTRVGEAGM
ncbi:hypothetical protein A1O1_03102 [Capronia coronata CBS 617.96]|uniref:Autophagy-related protein 9 n=1 Tax=Capronia coronata CBS 617.96 TaxID=1182541 RepID=W9YYD2_9EURO|nr:uncharacterized protein A1O1_03102 [Capronia coronata CBS 617.96]EXJ94705.1 hypothetical protein A1O1_03102 [Capronia coronata CBS 617.96]